MDKKFLKIIIIIFIIISTILYAYRIYLNNFHNHSEMNLIHNRKFKNHVVFYPQHQDDEILWAGSAIISAINQCGNNNVYIVLVSDGSGVNVFNTNKKLKELSLKEKVEFRNNEFKAALNQIGIKKENIIILSDIDNTKGSHYDLMEKIMLEFENRFDSITHIAHHYEFDDHIMHRKNGQVLKKLYKSHKIKDAMYFIKPKYKEDIKPKYRVIYEVDNKNDYEKIKRACYEYKIVDEKNNRFGIGYTSSHNYFDYLLNDPKFTSILSIY